MLFELPEERQAMFGRTFPCPWDPATGGAALERPAPRAAQRIKDVLFGLAMAAIVAAVLYALMRGWIVGGVPAR